MVRLLLQQTLARVFKHALYERQNRDSLNDRPVCQSGAFSSTCRLDKIDEVLQAPLVFEQSQFHWCWRS